MKSFIRNIVSMSPWMREFLHWDEGYLRPYFIIWVSDDLLKATADQIKWFNGNIFFMGNGEKSKKTILFSLSWSNNLSQ
jgi:hypothetical protein